MQAPDLNGLFFFVFLGIVVGVPASLFGIGWVFYQIVKGIIFLVKSGYFG